MESNDDKAYLSFYVPHGTEKSTVDSVLSAVHQKYPDFLFDVKPRSDGSEFVVAEARVPENWKLVTVNGIANQHLMVILADVQAIIDRAVASLNQ